MSGDVLTSLVTWCDWVNVPETIMDVEKTPIWYVKNSLPKGHVPRVHVCLDSFGLQKSADSKLT